MKMTTDDNRNLKYERPDTSKEAESEQLELPLNLVAYPDALVLHTNQLSRELPKQDDITNIDYPVSRNKPTERITGGITFEEVREQLPSIDHTDMLVYVGVSRLFEEGYNGFTPQLVWRYATGNKDARATPKQRELVSERLDKMMSMILTVDVTAELVKAYKKKDAPQVEISENLLYLRKTFVTVQGRQYEGYELLEQPVLDRYSRELKQISYFERETLESGGGVEDALLNKYMAERIAAMKNAKNTVASNRILLSSIYAAMDVKEPSKHKRASIKNKVDALLSTWIGKDEIKKYNFVKKGRSWHAVDIIF